MAANPSFADCATRFKSASENDVSTFLRPRKLYFRRLALLQDATRRFCECYPRTLRLLIFSQNKSDMATIEY